MIDLFIDKDGVLRRANTSLYKAKNILNTQIGYLAYAPAFGIDYNLFFGDDFEIQPETFQAYAISKLSENGVNPLEVVTKENKFDTELNIQIQN
jgi:hypothetical protein